jgi:hypothetical protein
MDRALAMSYRTRSQCYFQNPYILRKSWLDMPFVNRWFEQKKKTYKGPTYRSASSWKLQPHLLGADPDAPMQLAILDNEIAVGNYKQNNEVPIEMSDSEKMQYSND